MHVAVVALAALIAAGPAWALYKVVEPDGRVTYTDRAPRPVPEARVADFQPGHAAAAEPAMPFGLAQVAQKFPVTLYTTSDCIPCDSARQLLQQRGVPFAEKRIATEADALALDQLGAGRLLPGLSVGARQLRGLDTARWTEQLDDAGYPRESRLPRNWTPPPVSALAAARAAGPAPAGAEPAAGRQLPAVRDAVPAPVERSPSTLRF
jgi:glutaredoxin